MVSHKLLRHHPFLLCKKSERLLGMGLVQAKPGQGERQCCCRDMGVREMAVSRLYCFVEGRCSVAIAYFTHVEKSL